jgi:hypothetical protein
VKWEYKIHVAHGGLADVVLNILGQEGWELVGVTCHSVTEQRFYFKRPQITDELHKLA